MLMGGELHNQPTYPQRSFARVAGLSLLLVVLTGVFTKFFVLGKLVTDDAASTASNILAHTELFRLGIVIQALSCVSGLVFVWAMYRLLKQVSESLALLGLLGGFTSTLISVFTLHDSFSVLYLLGAGTEPAAFPALQAQSWAMMLLSHDDGVLLSMVFFAFGSGVNGWLLFRSRLIPRLLAGWCLLAYVGVFAGILWIVLYPAQAPGVLPFVLLPDFLAQVLLGLWLLAKGTAARPTTEPEL